MSQLKAKQIKLNSGELILGNGGNNVLAAGSGKNTFLRVVGGAVQWSAVAATEIDSSAIAGKATVEAALSDLDTRVTSEVSRAQGEEARIEGKVDAEVTRATTAEQGISAALASEVTRATGVEGALQTELDATQAGAGLAANGGYTADATTTYIKTATSLFDADKKLDAAVKSLADNVAQGTGALQTEVDFIEAAVGLDADGKFVTIVGNYTGSATTVVEAIQAVDTAAKANADAISAEASRASTAEGQISADLASEVARATSAEGQIASDLSAEVSRATTAEQGISDALASEVTRATGAEAAIASNLASEVTRATAEEGTLVKLDGSRAMTGALDFGGFKGINLADPTADQDAATKKYVDSKVAGLGSVFEYKGLLDASEDALPTGAKNGDVYKVTASGNFSGVLAVNAGDMIVKTAEGWDKIDNTDPTVTNGANIVVSGNTDTGYTVALADALVGLTSVATGSLAASGNVTVGGTLVVTGGTTLGVVTAGAATVASLEVTGGANVGGDLDVSGAATFTSGSFSGLVSADLATQAAGGDSALTTKKFVTDAISAASAAERRVVATDSFAGTDTFELANTALAGSVVVYVNGLKINKASVSGTSTIVLSGLGYSLDADDVVEVVYEYNA